MSWWNAFTGANSALNLKPTSHPLTLKQPEIENARTSIVPNLAKSPVFTPANVRQNKKNSPSGNTNRKIANVSRNANAPFTPLGENLNTSMNKYMSNAVKGGKSRTRRNRKSKSKKQKKHTRRA